MSMNYYAVDDYGIVIKMEEQNFIRDILAKEKKDIDDWGNYEIADAAGCEYISNFTGEIFKISHDGSVDYTDSSSYDFDIIFYFSIPKWSTLFKPAYENMEELIESMKELYSEWLPNDYDYANHIYKIAGVYNG